MLIQPIRFLILTILLIPACFLSAWAFAFTLMAMDYVYMLVCGVGIFFLLALINFYLSRIKDESSLLIVGLITAVGIIIGGLFALANISESHSVGELWQFMVNKIETGTATMKIADSTLRKIQREELTVLRSGFDAIFFILCHVSYTFYMATIALPSSAYGLIKREEEGELLPLNWKAKFLFEEYGVFIPFEERVQPIRPVSLLILFSKNILQFWPHWLALITLNILTVQYSDTGVEYFVFIMVLLGPLVQLCSNILENEGIPEKYFNAGIFMAGMALFVRAFTPFLLLFLVVPIGVVITYGSDISNQELVDKCYQFFIPWTVLYFWRLWPYIFLGNLYRKQGAASLYNSRSGFRGLHPWIISWKLTGAKRAFINGTLPMLIFVFGLLSLRTLLGYFFYKYQLAEGWLWFFDWMILFPFIVFIITDRALALRNAAPEAAKASIKHSSDYVSGLFSDAVANFSGSHSQLYPTDILVSTDFDDDTLQQVDYQGDTLLAKYCRKGVSVNVIHALVEKGADPYHINEKTGNTLLHEAAMHNKPSIIRYLCHLGLDPDARNNNRETPLFIATTRNRAAAVHALMACGASLDARAVDAIAREERPTRTTKMIQQIFDNHSGK